LTNERCDNAIARDNFNIDTYFPGELRKQYRIDSPGQRRAVTQFLYSYLALGVMCEPNDGEFIPLDKDNGAQLAHWKPSVIQQASVQYKKNANKSKKQNHVEIDTPETDENITMSQEDDEFENATNLILGSFQK
jgi:hypothetical protein